MKKTILAGPPRLLLCCSLIWMAFSLTASLQAQNPSECRVTVLEIVAENTGQGLAAELKDLKKDLEKLNYSTYRLSNTYDMNLSFTQARDLKILGECTLVLTAEGVDENGKILLKVKLSSGKDKGLETLMRIPDGGTFLIGGPAHGKGVIILAFTAKI